MTFAASGEDVPMPARGLGQRVVVVARLALLASGQMRRRDLTGQSSVPLRAAGKYQQMRPWRIGIFGAWLVAQRQLGAEYRRDVQLLGGLGEPHHPVEPIVVCQRDGAQLEPGRLLDQFLGRARAVEE